MDFSQNWFKNSPTCTVAHLHICTFVYLPIMIIGTGIDIIEVDRIAMRVGRDSGFKELVFSKDEMNYCDAKASPFEHYAARFAAKEAFLKAVGRGWDSGLQWNEIEVVNEETGKPTLRVSGMTEKMLSPMGIRIIHVSLSHLKSMATAIVILET
jgi:holo-[acyl-carrier protein] synthase